MGKQRLAADLRRLRNECIPYMGQMSQLFYPLETYLQSPDLPEIWVVFQPLLLPEERLHLLDPGKQCRPGVNEKGKEPCSEEVPVTPPPAHWQAIIVLKLVFTVHLVSAQGGDRKACPCRTLQYADPALQHVSGKPRHRAPRPLLRRGSRYKLGSRNGVRAQAAPTRARCQGMDLDAPPTTGVLRRTSSCLGRFLQEPSLTPAV